MLLWGSAAPADDEPEWGEARAGLQVRLAIDEAPAVAGKIGATVLLRNVSSVDVALPKAGAKAFGWLIVQQDKTQLFTARLPLALPGSVPAGKDVEILKADVGPTAAYEYRKGQTFLDEYKAGRNAKEISAGALHKVLRDGPVYVKFYLYVVASDRPTLLKSNFVTATLEPPGFGNLNDKERKAFVEDLLKRFDRDAWSAMAACGAARKIGKPILPDLIRAVNERKRPGHSRMWLATAICGIGDPRSIEALKALLRDGVVDAVVAYHGPQQRDAGLDAAIIARAQEIKATRFTGYALLGCLSYRKSAPAELLQLGLDSPDGRTRAAAAEVFRHIGGGSDTLAALTRLLKDKEPNVRATAARVLGSINNRTPEVIGPLVEALDEPSDLVRDRICTALGQLTDQSIPYDPKAPEAEKQRVVDRWKAWWRLNGAQATPPAK